MPGPVMRLLLPPMLALVALPAAAVVVEDIPSPRPAGWTVDLTGTLQPDTVRALDQLGDEVKTQTGAELAVVVVPSTDGVPQRQFATELANRWGLGDREKNNGVLVFAALDDRAAEIVLGEGIDDAGLVTVALDIMHGEMVPRFRAGDPAGAIYHGALASAQRILGASPTAAGAALPAVTPPPEAIAALLRSASQPVPSQATYPAGVPVGGGGRGLALLATAGGLTLLGGTGLVLRRRRPRQCKDCRIPMVRLDEAEDDAHLAPAEQVEERVGSVDYDVWMCPACNLTEKLRYGAFFTSYATCPQCGARTASSTSWTEREATTSSEGRARVDESCEHCDYRQSFTRVIPRVVEREPSTGVSRSSAYSSSSSSSSSSRSSSSRPSSSGFGGGRSGGGGASGRW